MINVKVQGVDEVLSSLKRVDVETQKKLQNQMVRSGSRVLADAKQNTPVAFGRLRSSGKLDVSPKTVKVSFGAGYAKWVEFGRRAGKWPPPDTIKDWVRKRGLGSGNEVDSIAYLISRKIALKGTRKQPFLRPAFERERARFKSALKTIIK